MKGELTKAHNQFLKDVGTIQQTQENAFHSSKYASLEGVLSVVNPALSKNGLSVYQTFTFTEQGQHVLHTTLAHVSGESIESSALFPPSHNKNPLHGFGANCTYMRRYTLLAILGICAGIHDDDGNGEAPPSLNSQVVTPTQTKPAIIEREPPLTKEDREELLSILVNLRQNGMPKFQQLESAYRKKFPDCGERFSDHIQTPLHRDFILKNV